MASLVRQLPLEGSSPGRGPCERGPCDSQQNVCGVEEVHHLGKEVQAGPQQICNRPVSGVNSDSDSSRLLITNTKLSKA